MGLLAPQGVHGGSPEVVPPSRVVLEAHHASQFFLRSSLLLFLICLKGWVHS